MQLSEIRNEVYAKGFGTTTFPASRVTAFINDGYLSICRRVNYYVDEATYPFSTAVGTALYPLPANWGRIRELQDLTRTVVIPSVGLRDIDQSGVPPQGVPQYYAVDGSNLHLWPNPAGVYSMQLRYWMMPNLLVNDTDVPTLPADYHQLLWLYATWQCYESDDDPSMGQYWMNRFKEGLAEFAADVKFPDTESFDRAESMWESGRGLQSSNQWSVFGGWI